MRRSIAAVFAVILMITQAGCARDTGQAIEKRYRDLQSYSTQLHVTVTGNKGRSEYQLSQVFQAPDQCRTEVLSPETLKGTVSIICGEDIYLLGGNAAPMALKQSQTDAVDSLSVAEFFRSYFADGEMEKNDDKVMLHIVAKDNNPYRTSRILQLDAKTLLPTTMSVFDKDGNEVIEAKYIDFLPDAKIEKGVFTP